MSGCCPVVFWLFLGGLLEAVCVSVCGKPVLQVLWSHDYEA